MSIEQIILNERNRYVKYYLSKLEEIKKDSPKTVGELLISINNDEIPYPYRYIRVDAITSFDNDAPKIYEIKYDIDPVFEAKGFNFGEFIVEVYPFTWNSIQILVNKPITNFKQLEGWITRWLDVEDKNNNETLGISQAVHSFTRVENNAEWWYLTGDFGTSPADALIEFIELMASQGMTRIVLKSGE